MTKVEELETVAQAYVNNDGECEQIDWLEGSDPDEGFEELVTRSQAEAIIAAKDAERQNIWFNLCNARENNEKLVADNAALTARVKELEGEVVFGFYEEEFPMYAQGYQGAGGCELCDPITAEEANGLVTKIKALETQLASARKALEPFADIADLIDSETEGMSETDELNLHFHDYEFARWPVSLLRQARAALEAKP